MPDLSLMTVLTLTLAAFLVIEGAVLLGLWFFRERSDATGAAPPWPLGRDLACTVLPAALLALIALPLLATCLTPMATP
ncbi:MAG: hypothetical protein AAB075_00045 [Gemmatimonadota bacterium]